MKKNGKSLALELVSDLLEDLSSVEQEDNNLESKTENISPMTTVGDSSEGDSAPSKHPLKAKINKKVNKEIETQSRKPIDLPIEKSLISSELSLVKEHIISSKLLQEVEERTLKLREENERLQVELQKFESEQAGQDKANQSLQNRILQLVDEIENEKLVYHTEKKQILRSLELTERQLVEEQLKRKELEDSLHIGVKKVRTRERELENRLEILKLESQSVSRAKDDEILKLNEKMDELLQKIKAIEVKSSELSLDNDEKKNLLRKAASTLKVTLTSIENQANLPKKAVGED